MPRQDEPLINYGDSLKVRYRALDDDGEYSPANLSIWLNGEKIRACRELAISWDEKDGVPRASIVFTMTELDIDAASLVALEVLVAKQYAN